MTKIITTSKLSESLGITAQRIYQLRRSGLLERASRNQWDQWPNVQNYAAYKSGSRYPGRPSVGERNEDIQSVFEFI
jgi:hypothetical protein